MCLFSLSRCSCILLSSFMLVAKCPKYPLTIIKYLIRFFWLIFLFYCWQQLHLHMATCITIPISEFGEDKQRVRSQYFLISLPFIVHCLSIVFLSCFFLCWFRDKGIAAVDKLPEEMLASKLMCPDTKIIRSLLGCSWTWCIPSVYHYCLK